MFNKGGSFSESDLTVLLGELVVGHSEAPLLSLSVKDAGGNYTEST